MGWSWGGAGEGAAGGAAAGAPLGPWGVAGGAVVGGILGGFGGEDPSEAAAKSYFENVSEPMQQQFLSGFGTAQEGVAGAREYLSNVKMPDFSGSEASLGTAENLVGRLSNYKPERIDRALGEQRAEVERAGTRADPMMVRLNQEQQAQNRLTNASQFLTAADKAKIEQQGGRDVAQRGAEIASDFISQAYDRIAALAQGGDALVAQTLTAAMQGSLTVASLKMNLESLPFQAQMAMVEALFGLAGMEMDLSGLALSAAQGGPPSPTNYGAGGQGAGWALAGQATQAIADSRTPAAEGGANT